MSDKTISLKEKMWRINYYCFFLSLCCKLGKWKPIKGVLGVLAFECFEKGNYFCRLFPFQSI